ncbi:EscT/YscT/HrcT family type III secretion system export apparatus protein [Sandaracinus amylolyticus]|uniref:EscT/YscT/HrcT family type III secretion system export apparatus protein n=1 Tax=Sandaracinus amylolyticus TaxID=927083 RepID=UPI001F47AF4B|nr:flagellar biosynthetic protein FliR [Sandaracinus amylolyticus]UJR79596.1 Flagellar biosynthesis protein FliR [Sandaracinus amylolyticus]
MPELLDARVIGVAILVASRVAPLTVVVPWLALRDTPPALRAALLLVLTIALTPLGLSVAPALPEDTFALAALALREGAIGLVFAIATAIPLIALDHAGRVIDAMRAPASSAEITTAQGETTSPLGQLHLLLGTVIFLGLGGHRLVIAALGEGLVAVPPGATIPSVELAEVALGAARIVTHALTLAVAFAAPAAIALIALEVLLGVASRLAPAVSAPIVSMPLRAAAGLAAVLFGLAVLVPHLPEPMRRAIDGAEILVRDLAP